MPGPAMLDRALFLPDLLDHAARWHGGATIVSRDGESVVRRTGYPDAAVRARRLAAAMRAAGVAAGDRVATIAANGLGHFLLFYAVPGLGAVCHTVNPRLPDDQIAYILQRSKPKLLVIDAAYAHLVERLPRSVRPALIWSIEEIEGLTAEAAEPLDWPDVDERAPAMLCYTSGSTGRPKGAVYTHRSLWLQAIAAATPAGLLIAPRDVVMPIVPMYHVAAWGTPYAAAAMGASLILPGPLLDGDSLVALARSERVTLAMAVPTVWTAMVEALERDGPLPVDLRAVVGGAALDPRLETRMVAAGLEPMTGWGMTETSALLGIAQPSHSAQKAPSGAQGKPVIGIDVRIVDADGAPLPQDGIAVGELQARGSWVIGRYFEDAGADAFTADGWLRTGDLALIDRHGYVRLVDRSKDVIKSGGEWVSPSDIEALSLAEPGVREAAAVAVADARWGERPLLFVRGEGIDFPSLRRRLAAGLARWQVPDRIELHPEPFPIGATGKISRLALRERAAAVVQEGTS